MEKQLSTLLEKYDSIKRTLNNKIEGYQNIRQKRIAISYLIKGLITSLTLIFVFLLFERTPLQSEFVRYVFAIIFFAQLVIFIYKAITSVLHPPKAVLLGVEIEQANEHFNCSLSSALDFIKKQTNLHNDHTSETLKKLTIASAGLKLKDSDINNSLKKFSLRVVLYVFACLLLINFLWLVISPLEYKIACTRMLFPWREITAYSALDFEVLPGNIVVARGFDLSITAIPDGNPHEPVLLALYEPDSDEANKVEMYLKPDSEKLQFLYDLTSLQDSLDYSVVCGKYHSEKYKIEVAPRPSLEKLNLTLIQPAYVSKTPVKLPQGVGDTEVLKNSSVIIEAKADQNLASASLILNNTELIQFELQDKSSIRYSIKVATDTDYSILLENEAGLQNEKPVRYSIKTLNDLPPTIEILQPGVDVPFPESRRLDIRAVARDDFGVKTMVFYYQIGERDSLIPLNLKPNLEPQKDFEVDFPWMLDTLHLQPGIKISYHIQVEDACEPKPNIATSPTFFVNMPSMYDLYRGEERVHDELSISLDEYAKELKIRRDSLIEAYEQIRHEGKLDYESQQALEKAIEQAEKQQHAAEDIARAFENLQEKMHDNPMSSPEALERLQKLGELLNEVLDDDAKQMMKNIQKALEDVKLDPKDIEKFEESFKMEEYIKDLDRTIDLLNQVKEQQKFNAMGLTIQDLMKRQQELASETAALKEKMQNGELAKDEEAQLQELMSQQEKIAQELEELQKKAEEMTKNLSFEDALTNPLKEELRQIKEKMQNEDYKQTSKDITENMKNKDLESAHREQQNMLKFLESLEKNAKEICNYASGASAVQLDFSDFIRRALTISFGQEEVYNQIEGLPGHFLRGQRPQIEGVIDQASVLQLLLKQQANDLILAIEEYIRTSFHLDPSVLDPVRGIREKMSDSVKDLEDRQMDSAREKQQETIHAFNRLVIRLMEAQDKGNESASSSMMNPMQQFKDLTRRQLSLYQEMMKKQSSPQSRQMMEELKRMSMQQRKVRESLQQLLKESGEQMRSMGRMEDIIKDMEQVETEILDPELRRKVAEKQRKIYERMLKAQKSIRNRDEESEERKATTAREIIQNEPDFPIDEMGEPDKAKTTDYLTDLREEYPETYKKMISDYFKALSIFGGEQ